MPSRLWRSTPGRLVLGLGAAFLVALAITAGLALWLIRAELAARVDRSVTDTYQIIARAYEDAEPLDLVESVVSHVSSGAENDRVYLLRDATGKVLAGNLTLAPARDGWWRASAANLGKSGADWRLYSGHIADFELTVGMSYGEADELGGLVATIAGWAGTGLVVLVAGAGLAVARSGQRRIAAIAATMERLGRGDLTARIALSRRGDDIDALSASVNAALERLAALVEGMRQVSVDIAHELKTPLNRLGILLEVGSDTAARGEPVGEVLERAQAEARQINATFDALLRIAQIEAGARRTRFARVALGPLVETLGEIYAPVAADAGQVLRVGTVDAASIHGDRELLTQMAANLIENAIRHCPAGAEIALALENGVLSVADTGPGIPEAERAKVFRRLYRLEQSRTTPGSGLGLSLVKAIAELHGASIEMADNGPGLRVTVRFPIGAAA